MFDWIQRCHRLDGYCYSTSGCSLFTLYGERRITKDEMQRRARECPFRRDGFTQLEFNLTPTVQTDSL